MNVTGFYWWLVNIGSGNNIRQQAITWANADLDLCHHMAPLGHNELSDYKFGDLKLEGVGYTEA